MTPEPLDPAAIIDRHAALSTGRDFDLLNLARDLLAERDRLAAELAAMRDREQRVLDRVLNLRVKDSNAVPMAVDVHAILRPPAVILAEMEDEARAALAGEGWCLTCDVTYPCPTARALGVTDGQE